MMILYSGASCPFSHRCRIVLFEKAMDFEVRDIDMLNKPEDIHIMNPYGTLPILVERDLVLYESTIINEFIEERWPHPQLMPYDPVLRARIRLITTNLERELFSYVSILENERGKNSERLHEKARQEISTRLLTMVPLFEKSKYLLGNEMTMVDVNIAPLLWRLQHYGIAPSKLATPMLRYTENLFARPAFLQALTPAEKIMRR